MSHMGEMREQARERAIQAADRRLAEPRPRHRLDGSLFAVLGALIAIAAGGSYAVASWISASGRLDPPLLTEVEDPRILADYRDNASPMGQMVAIGDDLLIGRQDGSIDRFDVVGRTFAAESLPRNDNFSGQLALLSTDCPVEGCDATASAYAVTTAGGLAERRNGEWRVLLGDGAFRAPDGTSVEQADVTGWAASADGSHVLVNAGDKGLGLFDQRSGVWHRRSGIADAEKGPLFHDGSFWLGAKDGVHRLTVGPTEFTAMETLVPGTEGEIIDLAPSASDGLLALRRAPCEDGQIGCLSLLSMDQAGEVRTLHAEVQLDPNLNDSGLRHVARQGENLVTIGTAGVHRYSSASRNWTAIARQEPTAYFAEAGGDRLLVGLPDSFIVISNGTVTARTTLDAPLKQILPGVGAELFGLDDRGRVLRLEGATAVIMAEVDPGAPVDATFVRAAAIGPLFVALGPQGILVHDSEARRYSFTPANALPPLPVSDMLLVPGSGRLWIVARNTGEVRSLLIAGDFPAKDLSVEEHGTAGTAVAQAHANADGLDLVATDGTLLRLASADGRIAPLVGPGLPQSLQPVSMAATGSAYVFADKDGIWHYDQDDRTWAGPDAAPQDGEGLTDIAIAGDRLVARDGNGTVYWRSPQGWSQVYGGPVRARFGALAVQDVMASAQTLFLASDSMVQAYAPGSRRFGSSWRAAGRNAEILAIIGTEPLWKNSNGIFAGEDSVFDGAGFIDGWMGANGPVAMAERAGRRYLSDRQGCLFMGVAAPRGEVKDVVALNEGRLLVRTATEAGMYQPDLHRWLRVTGLGGSANSRFLNIGGHLVRLDPTRISSVPISAIEDVGSCDTSDINIDWQVNLTGTQVSQVDGAPQVLVLTADGALRRWAGGEVATVAPATGEAPAMTGPGKVYAAANGGIHFLTPDALWHYRLSDRTWSTQAFDGAPRAVAQFDLVHAGSTPVVSLWDSNDELWKGQGDASGQIAFEKAVRPWLPTIPITPADIRDMAQFQGGIAVLSDRRLLTYDRDRETPRADIALPAPVDAWSLASDSEGDLILIDGNISAPIAIHRIDRTVARQTGLATVSAGFQPGEDRDYVFSRTDGTVRLFRIDRDLNAWQCNPVTGRATPDCDLLAGPPMQLDPQDIRAFDEPEKVLMTENAIWSLDDALRPLGRIDGPVAGLESVLFHNGIVLMLWEGPGGGLWRIEGRTATQVLEKVDFLQVVGDSHAALVEDKVVGIVDGQVVGPRRDDQIPDDPAAHAHFTKRGHVVLTQGGVALAHGGQKRSDPLIRFDADVVTVLPAQDGSNGDMRWLQEIRGGKLVLIWADQCEVPVPPPAPLPPEFIGPPAPIVEHPPAIEPCVRTRDLPVRLNAGEHVIDLDSRTSGVLSIMTNQRELAIGVDVDGEDGSVQNSPIAPFASGEGGRDTLRGKLAEIDGLSYLNPPNLSPAEVTGVGDQTPIARLAPAALGAFDEGWIRWQRDGNRVQFDAASQPVDMVPSDAIRDGRFLPAHPARGAVLADGKVAWLNAFGLWHQRGQSMQRVSEQGMAQPEALYQGVFLDGQQGIAATDGAVAPGPGPRVFDVDALEFTVDPLRQRATATMLVAGRKVQAFGARGFRHDQRQSVAQTKDAAAYLTPIGLIPQLQLGGAQVVPADTQRLESENGRFLARTPSGWMAQDGQAQWRPAEAPFLGGRLAAENGRIWERVDGSVALRSAEPGQDWRLARQGLDFDIDQLLSFAATPQVAVAVTRSGTHAAPAVKGLAGAAAPNAPAPGSGELDADRVTPARHVLFHKGAAGYQVWDAAQSQWRISSNSDRPWESREMASVGGVSVAFRGKVEFDVAVEVVGQGARTLPFEWSGGDVMPFDHVTAIHGDPQDGMLLVGTRLGMRRLTPLGDGYANQQLFVPARGASAPAVRSIGRPATAPERIVAAYASGCVQFATVAAAPTACDDPSALSEKFVAQTGYWRWTKSDAAVRGEYLLEAGMRLPLVEPLRGRLPHDSLADSLICQNGRAELWRDADVLRVGGKQHLMPGAEALFCQSSAVKLEGGTQLDAGLYVLTATGVLHMDGGTFAMVGTRQADAIADRASGRVVLDRGRLRYGIEQDAAVAYRLDLANQWRPVAWHAGRLLLDQPRALAWHDRGVQFVTDAGVFDAPEGRLDPARLIVMSGPDEIKLAACAAEHVETLDGRSHGLDREAGDPLRLYCKDGSWLQGVADNRKDVGAFQTRSAAPSQRMLVDAAPLWRVRQDVDAAGRVQGLAVTFRDEQVRLTAGRFDFDTFRAIAAPFSGQTELLSETGWWRAPSGVPLLPQTQRLPAGQVKPRDIRAMTTDRSQRSNILGLCLAMSDGRSMWWDGDGLVEAVANCREIRGDDPLWSWWQADDQPLAIALAAGGAPVERRISAGRFEDLIIQGAPLSDPQGRLLVPGGLGVLVLDRELGQPIAIHTAPGDILLTRTADWRVLQLDRQGAIYVEEQPGPAPSDALACPALATLASALPEENWVSRVDMQPGRMASVMTVGPEGVRQLLLRCDDPSAGRAWTAAVDISQHPRALAGGPGRADMLTISLDGSDVRLADGNRAAARGFPVAQLQGILPRPDGKEIFIMGDDRLWSSSVSAAIGILQRGAAAAPLIAPEPKPVAPAAPVQTEAPIVNRAPDREAPTEGQALPPARPLISAESLEFETGFNPEQVQIALRRRLGIDLAVDGMIGADTRRAIAEWQTRIDSKPTGYLGLDQLQVLLKEVP